MICYLILYKVLYTMIAGFFLCAIDTVNIYQFVKHLQWYNVSLIFSQDKNNTLDSPDFKSTVISKNVVLLTRSVIIHFGVVIYSSK